MGRSGLRSHLSGSVPISIAVHFVVLGAILVVPLSEIVLPVPPSQMEAYVQVAAVPPPPAFVPARAVPHPVAPAPDVSTIPLVAPNAIRPEIAAIPDIAVPDGPPSSGSYGSGVGSVAPPVVLPVEPPHRAGPIRAAELPQAPRKLVDARPLYPEIARAAHVDGTVVLEAVLDPTGRVTQLRVVKSVPLLDEAALEAVRQWRYSPSIYGGRPVSVLMTITIHFSLQQ